MAQKAAERDNALLLRTRSDVLAMAGSKMMEWAGGCYCCLRARAMDDRTKAAPMAVDIVLEQDSGWEGEYLDEHRMTAGRMRWGDGAERAGVAAGWRRSGDGVSRGQAGPWRGVLIACDQNLRTSEQSPVVLNDPDDGPRTSSYPPSATTPPRT